MTKCKKTIIIVVSVIVCLALMAYVALGFLLKKPGMNGFTVMHGTAKLVLSGKDYVKVGEDRYLFKGDYGLKRIIEDEYNSSLGFIDQPGSIYWKSGYGNYIPYKFAPPDFMSYDEFMDEYFGNEGFLSTFSKSCCIIKDGHHLRGDPLTCGDIHRLFGWGMENTIRSVYFAPLD